MTVTLLHIDQIHRPFEFDDSKTAVQIAAIEGSAVDYKDYNNAVLSQLKRILKGGGSGDWKDDPTNFDGKDGSLAALVARTDLADKLALLWRLNLNDVTVPNAQNWVTLAATGQPPDVVGAIANSQRGAVVAQLGGAVGSHSLVENSGTNQLKPRNLVAVLDGSTGDAILSSGRRVYGLLQVGATFVDGVAFAITGAQLGQISFVRPNATFDDLEACPAADVQNLSIIYAYTHRNDLNAFDEDAFRGDVSEADPNASVIVSLDSAYDGGAFMTVDASDVDIRLANTKSWIFRKGSGSQILFEINRVDDGTADQVHIGTNVDLFNNDAADSDFAEGMTIDSAGQAINMGKTAVGVLDSATIETRANTGTNKVTSVAGDVKFATVRELLSGGLPLDDASVGSISALKTVLEGSGTFASIAEAIKYAAQRGGVDLTFKTFVAGIGYSQGANIPAATVDLTAFSLDANTVATCNAFLFLNGRLLFGGNGTTKNDVYAGSTPASGDIMVDFPGGIRTGDVILTIALKTGTAV